MLLVALLMSAHSSNILQPENMISLSSPYSSQPSLAPRFVSAADLSNPQAEPKTRLTRQLDQSAKSKSNSHGIQPIGKVYTHGLPKPVRKLKTPP